MIFKARIDNYLKNSTVNSDTLILDTYFSKKYLIKHINVWDNKNEEWPPNPEPRKVYAEYILSKEINPHGKTEFRIKFKPPVPDVSFVLKMNWYNKMKCNLMHNGYIINKDGWEWTVKLLIGTLLVAMVGFICTRLNKSTVKQETIPASILK